MCLKQFYIEMLLDSKITVLYFIGMIAINLPRQTTCKGALGQLIKHPHELQIILSPQDFICLTLVGSSILINWMSPFQVWRCLVYLFSSILF